MTDAERDAFDRLLEEVLESLPPNVAALLEEISLVVMDRPTPEMVESLRADGLLENEDGTQSDGSDLCGLHSGLGLTERSIQDGPELPDQIHLFREGIVGLALEESGLSLGSGSGEERESAENSVYEEVRITLLHEIGHHFGLDEDDLEELGYD